MLSLYKTDFIIIADDHSRVILDRTHSEPNTDYINANFIDVSYLYSP